MPVQRLDPIRVDDASHSDLTPEELHARDLANWRSTDAALHAEHEMIRQRVEREKRELADFDELLVEYPLDVGLATKRLRCEASLRTAERRVGDIDEAITAHRGAKP